MHVRLRRLSLPPFFAQSAWNRWYPSSFFVGTAWCISWHAQKKHVSKRKVWTIPAIGFWNCLHSLAYCFAMANQTKETRSQTLLVRSDSVTHRLAETPNRTGWSWCWDILGEPVAKLEWRFGQHVLGPFETWTETRIKQLLGDKLAQSLKRKGNL